MDGSLGDNVRKLILLLMLLFAIPAMTATLYTSSTGTDSGDCQTLSHPCNLSNSLHYEFDQVTASNGDIIYMCAAACDGTGSAVLDIAMDEGAAYGSIPSFWGHVPVGTSWENAMTVMPYPGETITWKPNYDYPIRLCKPETKYTIWKNFAIDGSLKTSYVDGAAGITVGYFSDGGVDHNRFQGVEVKNCAGVGIYNYAQYTEYIDMSIHDTGFSTEYPYPDGRGHAIYLSSGSSEPASSSYVLIQGGSIYNQYSPDHYNRYAIHSNYTTYANSHIRVKGVKIYHNTHGILFRGGSDNIAYNNLIYDSYYYGFVQYSDGSSTSYNNTFVDNYGPILLDGASVSATARNNIYYSNTVDDVSYLNEADSGDLTESNNLKGTDPLFTNYAGGDYSITSSSPAKDTGYNLAGTVDTDYIGTSRPQPLGGSFDIGAYELSQSSGDSHTMDIEISKLLRRDYGYK